MSTIRLPHATAFAKLSLTKRTVLFIRWMEKQPRRREYEFFDIEMCPLAMFGKALFRLNERVIGGSNSVMKIGWDDVEENVVVFKDRQDQALRRNYTYGAATDALKEELLGEK